MSNKPDSELNELTVSEVARELAVNPRTVRRWCDAGLLKYRRVSPLPKSRRMITAESVANFKAQRE